MLTLLYLCVISTLLLPYCRGSTTPSYDEVTTDYTDYTFDYSMTEFPTMDYDGYEVLDGGKNKGSTTPSYDEVTTDYTDYTFDYSIKELSTMDYDGNEDLVEGMPELTTMDYDDNEVAVEGKNKVELVNDEASTVKHGCYAIPLAVMVQQFCQQT